MPLGQSDVVDLDVIDDEVVDAAAVNADVVLLKDCFLQTAPRFHLKKLKIAKGFLFELVDNLFMRHPHR